MSRAKTWHLWRCDGCGMEKQLPHGDWAEPQLPVDWFQSIGWDKHACSEGCLDAIQTAHQRESGKRYIFLEWKAAS
jgi:hypothetical protein